MKQSFAPMTRPNLRSGATSGALGRMPPGKTSRVALWVTASFALTLLGNACALGEGSGSKPLVKECVLPTDQSATLSGRWRVTPVPIAFHSGSQWAADEIADMVQAADTWNSFYQATQGIQVLDYGTAESPRMSAQAVPTSVCSQGILQGKQFTGQVVIYKQGRWPHASGAQSTMALTNFCTSPGKPFNSIYMAYLEVNYQYFFVSGRKLPDLRTIIAHEFGHLLGLYHSCDIGSTKSGSPDCAQSSLKPEYREALMFPVFGFDENYMGEKKHDLTSNDEGRANCLYEVKKASTQ